MSSIQAGNAVKEAVHTVNPEFEVKICPLADGGEGTVEALCQGLNGKMISATVMGPLQNAVNAEYCIFGNNVAVIEMASAAGITLISEESRNPLKTTTYGVGELIVDAIGRGCRDFIIGIGGSATNDGGVGMLTALGFKFLDKFGNSIPYGAEGLSKLHSISTVNVLPEIKKCRFKIACDVTNPLCGIDGCSAVFGPQKGATSDMVKNMDLWLKNYAEIAKTINSKADMNFPGSGAAGGLGFAFNTFLNSKLESGVNIVLDAIKIEEAIKSSDIVVTGEGRLDLQTVMGKAPIGVAKIAKKHGKKVIAFSGCVTEEAAVCNQHGIDAFFPIVRGVTNLEDALNPEIAYNNLVSTACQVFRLINIYEV